LPKRIIRVGPRQVGCRGTATGIDRTALELATSTLLDLLLAAEDFLTANILSSGDLSFDFSSLTSLKSAVSASTESEEVRDSGDDLGAGKDNVREDSSAAAFAAADSHVTRPSFRAPWQTP